MKNGVFLSLAIAVAAGVAAYDQKEVAGMAFQNDEAPKQDARPRQKERAGQGEPDRHHAFADPAERAKKWNDPERDKWQKPDEIVAALALKPGATVADIGAGTGYMAAPLSKAVGKGGTVIALDASAAMVEYLAKRTDELGPARVVPRKVGPDDPELQPAGVDRVLMLDTWHHVKGQAAYAKKIFAGLKRGGRLVVVEYAVDAEVGPPKAMRVAPGQVSRQLEAAGFRAAVVRESMPRHYLVVGLKD